MSKKVKCSICDWKGTLKALKRKYILEFDGNEELLYICPKCRKEEGIIHKK